MAGLGHVLTRPSEMHRVGEGTALEVRGEPEGLIRHHRRGCEARGQPCPLLMLCVLKQMPPLGREDPLEKEMATPLQYPCLENLMDGGAWEATVQGVAKSRTRQSDFTFFSLSPLWAFLFLSAQGQCEAHKMHPPESHVYWPVTVSPCI